MRSKLLAKKVLSTLMHGALGGFICTIAIMTLALFTVNVYTNEPARFTLGDLYALLLYAVFYGIPIGIIAFGASSWFLKNGIDITRRIGYLYLGTIVGGYLGSVMFDIVIGLVGAVIGYLLALTIIVVLQPK